MLRFDGYVCNAVYLVYTYNFSSNPSNESRLRVVLFGSYPKPLKFTEVIARVEQVEWNLIY